MKPPTRPGSIPASLQLQSQSRKHSLGNLPLNIQKYIQNGQHWKQKPQYNTMKSQEPSKWLQSNPQSFEPKIESSQWNQLPFPQNINPWQKQWSSSNRQTSSGWNNDQQPGPSPQDILKAEVALETINNVNSKYVSTLLLGCL